jgi:hypothetical protein
MGKIKDVVTPRGKGEGEVGEAKRVDHVQHMENQRPPIDSLTMLIMRMRLKQVKKAK